MGVQGFKLRFSGLAHEPLLTGSSFRSSICCFILNRNLISFYKKLKLVNLLNTLCHRIIGQEEGFSILNSPYKALGFLIVDGYSQVPEVFLLS